MLVLLLLLLLAHAGCGGADAPSSALLNPVELVDALQEGGYVVYLRHAATDRSKEDDLVLNLDDCTTQRNLSDAGREQSREIGRAFRELEIPVDQVLTSEYCRTRETAELAFGGAATESALTGFPNEGDADYEERIRQTHALLGDPPTEGKNTVLVAHIKNIEEAAAISIEEGELAVFEPLGGRRYRYRGRIPANAWPELVELQGAAV